MAARDAGAGASANANAGANAGACSNAGAGGAAGSSRRMSLAFFLAGFGTFALIYDVQPLLPEFPVDFPIVPATASLALSLTTLLLAASMLVVGRVSEVANRRNLMSASVIIASAIGVCSAFSPGWHVFLLLRALMGLALGGLPAVALAYLSDNVPAEKVHGTVGLYIAGTAFGGMAGRLLSGFMAGHLGWRQTSGAVSAICLAAGVLFYFALPRGDRRHAATPGGALGLGALSPGALGGLARRFAAQWRDALLPRLFVEGGVLMGCFVATYNYLCFRLQKAPFFYSEAQVSMIFLVYFFGMVASPMCGRLVRRFGVANVLRVTLLCYAAGALISIPDTLATVLVGATLVTVGFFAGHATASAWVNQRAGAGKAIASAQYLTVYYIGASLLGWSGGYAWQFLGWAGVAALVCACSLLGARLVPAEAGQPRPE